MSRRAAVLVLLVALVGVSIVGAVVVAGDDPGTSDASFLHACAAEMPDDYAPPETGNDTIGWVDGYWYDQPVELNATDGLTEAEVANLSARTAARLEAMRCLTFQELPPVEVITREEFANRSAASFATVDDRTRTFDNAQFETMLLIGSEEDSIQVRQDLRSVSVGGTYNFVEERITIIADDPDRLLIDEEVLAHELGHALQDQHFDLERYERNTKDLNNGKLGVIEGDVHRIEHQYLEHCEAERWSEPCVSQDFSTGANGEVSSWGLWFMQFQPYSDGPAFIEYVYQDGGWDGVNALYDDMPRTAIQIIHPEYYGFVEPEDLIVDDLSEDEWERLTWVDEPDHNVIGQAGLAGMFLDPALESHEFDHAQFFNDESADSPYNYAIEYADGWRGDRLYVYTNGDDTGAVWKIAWENEDELETFVEGYERLIEYHGGEPDEQYEDTWTFGDESAFDMSLTIYADDDRLWIVTAPTSADILEIHSGIELVEQVDNHPRPPLGDGIVDDYGVPGDQVFAPPDSPANGENGASEPEDDPIPGFGVLAFLVGILATLYILRSVGSNDDP